MIVAAMGCQQIKEARGIYAERQQLLLGSMDGGRLQSFLNKRAGARVYLYETG